MGFTFLFILLAPILVLIVILTIANRRIPMVSKILELSIVVILAVFVLFYLVLLFFYGDFEWGWIFSRAGQIIRIGILYWFLYEWLFYATGKSLVDDLAKIKRGEILPSKELWVPAVFLFTLFILYSTFYANIVFPNIHSSLGGGKPIPAEIHISKKGIQTVESMGLVLDSNQNLLDISIIHETSTTIYITPPNAEEIRSIALPKNTVQGVRFLSSSYQQ